MFYNNKRLFYRMCEMKRSGHASPAPSRGKNLCASEEACRPLRTKEGPKDKEFAPQEFAPQDGPKEFAPQEFAPQDGVGADICIQIERGKKRYYTSFESVDSLEQWYRQLSDEERTCHEVVAGERRKLVIDIDGEEDGRYDFYDFAKHIVSRIQCVFLDMEIGVLQTKDVLVYNMCSESIISYHAIVANMTFSADTCRGLCAIISHGQIWESLVDHAVYKRVQHIRIEGSTKYGQRRWKNLAPNDTGVAIEGAEDDDDDDERTCCNGSFVSKNFQKSLLSNVCGVMHPSVEYIIKYRVEPMTQVLTTHEIFKDFKVRRVSGNRVFLDRIRPSMCIKCDRVHMRENAMICPRRFLQESALEISSKNLRKPHKNTQGVSEYFWPGNQEYTLVCWRSM